MIQGNNGWVSRARTVANRKSYDIDYRYDLDPYKMFANKTVLLVNQVNSVSKVK
jgi:hypothetical protein